MEGVGTRESRGVDGGAQGGFGVCGPFGAVAGGDFSLDDAGPQGALADIVGGVDLAGKIAEGEYLAMRAADLAEQLARQRTFSLLNRGDGQTGNIAGELKGPVEPELKPHADEVAAMLGNEGSPERLPWQAVEGRAFRSRCARQVW